MKPKFDDTAIPYEAKCKITTYTHFLHPSAFNILDDSKTNLFVEDVQKESMIIGITNRINVISDQEKFIRFANIALQDMTIALNDASLGLFMWEIERSPSPIYQISDPVSNLNVDVMMAPARIIYPDVTRQLTAMEVDRAILLLGVLFREDDQNVRAEYIKGMIHLVLGFSDISFNREAFGNFFRSWSF